MLASPHGDTPVLVLAPHAQTGRRISMVISLLFIFGFHSALVYASIMNWDLPCERPLSAFLLSAGVIGIVRLAASQQPASLAAACHFSHPSSVWRHRACRRLACCTHSLS